MIGFGKTAVDYNDTLVVIEAIGRLEDMIRLLQFKSTDLQGATELLQTMLNDGYNVDTPFYLVIVKEDNKSVPATKGQRTIYPVEYNMTFYYGLEEVEDKKSQSQESMG